MKCWVCSRQARGSGHSDNRFPIGDRRRYPIDWVFCSSRCQNAFHLLYGSWTRALDKDLLPENAVLDATVLERAAMRVCLKSFGDAASDIGFDLPLGAYSPKQALFVIEAIVTAFVAEMAAQHERLKFPSVRTSGTPMAEDPMRPSAPLVENPFADMQNDLPWELR